MPAAGMAPPVAQQLAQTAVALAEGRVEIRLAPEELGRVMLTLTVAEGGVSVAVLAERSETLDLLRRNIGLLGQELRDLGYANPGFSFAEGRRPPSGDKTPAGAGIAGADAPEPPQLRPASATPEAGLDLRL